MRVEVVAECGLNAGRSLPDAIMLARAAKLAGADAAKFQTFVPSKVLRRSDPDYYRIAALAMSFEDTAQLARACRDIGIEFFSTPGDLESLAFLVEECGVRRIKIGSDDLMNRALVGAAYASDLPVVLSTGMATIREIGDMLMQDGGYRRVTLMHTTSLYPCPPAEANLLAMDTIARSFKLPVGYSDHTTGADTCIIAAALGASIVEKHMKLAGTAPIDDAVSIDERSFHWMVEKIRDVEVLLGSPIKEPGRLEATQIPLLRKGSDGLRGVPPC